MNTKEAVKKDVDVQRVQKANKVKSRIKKICGQMDDLKTGLLDPDVFFQVLKLNKIDLSEQDKTFLREKTEKNVNGKQKIQFKDAVKWVVIDLTYPDIDSLKWIVRTKDSMLASMKDSTSDKMSVLSGLSDLSDISGITELKAQLKAKE